MVKRAAWLSITPEPERELPAAVATLSRGALASPQQVSRERARIERLVVRGSQRQWLSYLSHVAELIERTEGERDPEVAAARRRAIAVLANHHNLLLGLPGRGAQRTTTERARLERLTNPTHEQRGQT